MSVQFIGQRLEKSTNFYTTTTAAKSYSMISVKYCQEILGQCAWLISKRKSTWNQHHTKRRKKSKRTDRWVKLGATLMNFWMNVFWVFYLQKENVNLETLGFESGDVKNIRQLSIRSILQESVSVQYLCTNAEKDMILMISSSAKYGTTVVGLEMMRSVHEENAEENRKVQIVKSAIKYTFFLRTWGRSSIFSMNWTEQKAFW